VLVGFYSCCIFEYDFVVYMVHSIIPGIICFSYFILEIMFSIAYVVLYTEMNAARCFSLLYCALYKF